MSYSWRRVLVFVTLVALLASNVTALNSRPPRNSDINNMADALKYLQDLDTYYGDRARVRFGKRASLMHLANEAVMNRPLELSAAEEPF